MRGEAYKADTAVFLNSVGKGSPYGDASLVTRSSTSCTVLLFDFTYFTYFAPKP